MSLKHANAPSAEVEDDDGAIQDTEEVTADGRSSTSALDPPTHHPELCVFNETEHPGQRRSAVGGRRLKQQKVNKAAESPGEDENAVAWDDCISANIQLPTDFYPKDNGRWTVEVVDATLVVFANCAKPHKHPRLSTWLYLVMVHMVFAPKDSCSTPELPEPRYVRASSCMFFLQNRVSNARVRQDV
eukprot:1419437-Rhodomonas_salina.2